MPDIYRFNRLIKKYSVPFTLEIEGTGYRDNIGEWVDGEPVTSTQYGAIIPLTKREIYESGGALTSSDRTLIINKMTVIPLKSKIHYGGDTYHVEALIPYSDYGDFNTYTLRSVSNFNEVQT